MTESKVCNHLKWNINSQNIGTCANPECGEVRQFPLNKGDLVTVLKPSKCNNQKENPVKKKTKERLGIRAAHAYYEKNKEAIITDLLSMGRPATRKKWGIPAGGTLPQLEKKWLTPEQKAILGTKAITQSYGTNHFLPCFPEFSMTWPPEIQLKWFEIYEKLLDRCSSENG